MNFTSLANKAGSPHMNRPLSLACKEMWSTLGSGVGGGIIMYFPFIDQWGHDGVFKGGVFSPPDRLQWVWMNGSHILYMDDPVRNKKVRKVDL